MFPGTDVPRFFTLIVVISKLSAILFLEHDSRLGFRLRVLVKVRVRVRLELRLRLVLGLWLGCGLGRVTVNLTQLTLTKNIALTCYPAIVLGKQICERFMLKTTYSTKKTGNIGTGEHR